MFGIYVSFDRSYYFVAGNLLVLLSDHCVDRKTTCRSAAGTSRLRLTARFGAACCALGLAGTRAQAFTPVQMFYFHEA